jgi:hypothetical protein
MIYYVRLVQGKGLLSRLIEFKESEWPSHVELIECTDHNDPVRVLGSRYAPWTPDQDGVRIRRPDAFPLVRECWYKTRTVAGPNFCEIAWRKMETQIGRKYDARDIVGISLDTDWHKDGRWICSEITAWSFEAAECPLFNTAEPMRRIWPRDFLLTPRLRLYQVVTH